MKKLLIGTFVWQVDKKTVKTRAFQEACIFSAVDELAKHLAQWSYSIAFFEMSFLTLVRLQNFCKTVKADRFRREIKDLIHQVCEACKRELYLTECMYADVCILCDSR